jgi:hypothetical protein
MRRACLLPRDPSTSPPNRPSPSHCFLTRPASTGIRSPSDRDECTAATTTTVSFTPGHSTGLCQRGYPDATSACTYARPKSTCSEFLPSARSRIDTSITGRLVGSGSSASRAGLTDGRSVELWSSTTTFAGGQLRLRDGRRSHHRTPSHSSVPGANPASISSPVHPLRWIRLRGVRSSGRFQSLHLQLQSFRQQLTPRRATACGPSQVARRCVCPATTAATTHVRE